MPRIQINEIDLTTASYQLSSTDIVFVPGLSILKDAPKGLTFCASVADFEENFGTTPAIEPLKDKNIKTNIRNAKSVGVKFIQTTGADKYKKFCDDNKLGYSNTFVCINGNDANSESDNSRWQTSKFTRSLAEIGLEVNSATLNLDYKKVEWFAPTYNNSINYYEIVSKKASETKQSDVFYFTLEDGVYKKFTGSTFDSDTPYYKAQELERKPKDWSTKFNKYFTIVNGDAYPCALPTYKKDNYYYATVDGETVTYEKIEDTSAPENWGYSSCEVYDCTSNPTVDFAVGDTIVITPTFDLSYVYAKELLLMGLPVMYHCIDGNTYEGLDWTDVFNYSSSEGIMDKGEYSVKYLTSGANPSFQFTYNIEDGEYDNAGSFYSAMLQVAANRGDCVAIIDGEASACAAEPSVYTDNDGTIFTLDDMETLASVVGSSTFLNAGSLWGAAKYFFGTADHTEYGTMFTPWATYTTSAAYFTKFADGTKTLTNGLSTVLMPPSFGYLKALAKSIRTNASWLAVAGVTRGPVPSIKDLYTTKLLSNTVANEMQPRNGETSINAITNIKPYGLTIWGNRTLKNNLITAQGGEDGLVATSFLNIRNLVSDVKKVVYNAAKILMFEQNTQILWINFMSKITPELDKMVSGQGLSSYKVIQVPTKEKAKLQAVIKIYPLYAVEDFEISIEIRDDDTVVVS